MKKPFSNQATPKYLGFVYQILIALDKCFDAKKNQTIWVECFGDIYDGTKSIEVKHHSSGGNLASNSVDVWKTLKNIVIEDTSDMGEFILHTTQKIPTDSIFYEWNTLTPTKKYTLMKNHSPSDTALPYYSEVMKVKRRDLLPILKVFIIKSSQIQVEEFWSELSNHRHLTSIHADYREDAVKWLHGYINLKAVQRPYYWHININDFDEDYRVYCQKFKTNKIPFPNTSKDLVNKDTSVSFSFLSELKDIGVKKRARAEAVSDYLRSISSELELLQKRPVLMQAAMSKFEKDVKRQCYQYKNGEAGSLEEYNLGTELARASSFNAYNSFQKSSVINIDHVDDTEHYFMTGKASHSIEKANFTWKYTKEDVE
jgi:hypothetical protein